jgi:hypothetical protein
VLTMEIKGYFEKCTKMFSTAQQGCGLKIPKFDNATKDIFYL